MPKFVVRLWGPKDQLISWINTPETAAEFREQFHAKHQNNPMFLEGNKPENKITTFWLLTRIAPIKP